MTWSTDRPSNTRAKRAMRARVLREEPTCRVDGCAQPSTEDDHIVPWSQREAHGLTIEEWQARPNHQGLCEMHHRAKTHAESMAGRRPPRRRPPRAHPADA